MERSNERSFEELPCMTVAALDTAEQFVVGVFRCWDAFQRAPDPAIAWREFAPVFAYMGVLGALCAVDSAFHVVQQHRLQSLIFAEVDGIEVGLTEACFLGSLASLQRGNVRYASGLMAGVVCRRGLHALLPPLARVASILDGKGHRLPAWQDTPPCFCGPASQTYRFAASAESALPQRRRSQ